MSWLDIFGKAAPAQVIPQEPVDVRWKRTASGRFQRLSLIDTAVPEVQVGGVFVLWHVGVKPQWVFVDMTDNIGHALDQCVADKEMRAYITRGGLIVTWAEILPEYRAGVVKYLEQVMRPAIPNPKAEKVEDDPIPVFLPGKEPSKKT